MSVLKSVSNCVWGANKRWILKFDSENTQNMKIRMVIRPGKIVIFCARHQDIEILGIEMYIDGIQKMLVFSFVEELGSFHVVNLC